MITIMLLLHPLTPGPSGSFDLDQGRMIEVERTIHIHLTALITRCLPPLIVLDDPYHPPPPPSHRLASVNSVRCICPAEFTARLHHSVDLDRCISDFVDRVVINVTEGSPSALNISKALEDHCDHSWYWKIQRTTVNSFLAIFPSVFNSCSKCAPSPDHSFAFWTPSLNAISFVDIVWIEILGVPYSVAALMMLLRLLRASPA